MTGVSFFAYLLYLTPCLLYLLSFLSRAVPILVLCNMGYLQVRAELRFLFPRDFGIIAHDGFSRDRLA